MFRRIVVVALYGCLALMAQEAAAPDLALFARTTVNTVQNLRSQPNYVCLDTIERYQKTASKKRFTLLDILRFEVAFVDRQELYAWPGSNRFDEKTLWEIVPPGGNIGTGSFAVHAYNLFVANGRRFLKSEWDQLNGKRVAKFPFDVSEMVSAYRIRSNDARWVTVAYHGNVWADPDTAQVLRIEVIVSDAPPQLDISETRTVVDYGQVKIGEQTYRLPVSSVDTMIRFNGTEQRNDSRFTGCRSYQTESKLSFGDPPPEEPHSAVPALEVTLPPGLDFHLELLTRIDSRTAQTGDVVEARLATPIKHNREILFDKKSAVEGRLIRLQRNGDSIEAEIQFESIHDQNKHAVFSARLLPGALPGIGRGGGVTSTQPVFGPSPRRKGALIVVMNSDRLVLLTGARSAWTTE